MTFVLIALIALVPVAAVGVSLLVIFAGTARKGGDRPLVRFPNEK